MRSILPFVAAASLAACTIPDKVLTDSGDDVADPDGTEADTTPPAIVSSDPIDGARPVSVLADLSVTFDEGLDETTISAATMTLRPAGMRWTIPGVVSYDPDTRKATFSSHSAFRAGAELTLALDGIADPAGNVMPATTISFHTYRNPHLRDVWYMNGQVDRWHAFALDAAGDLVRETRYTDAGVDGVWLTSDDAGVSSSTHRYDAAKRSILMVNYEAAGADEVWGNGDDVVTTYVSYSYDADGHLTRAATFNGAGADLVWFTPDDVMGFYEIHEYDVMGAEVRSLHYNTGPDAIGHTSDDQLYYRAVMVNDTLGRPIANASYGEAGADGIWFTADDTLMGASGSRYNQDGSRQYVLNFSGVGADQTWGTSDDVIRTCDRAIYDSGILVGGAYYDDAGIDQQWFTSDDHVQTRTEGADFVAKDLAARETTYAGAGVDGVWFTADDAISGQRRRTFNSDGNRRLVEGYGSPGIDGTWFTADDQPSFTFTYDDSL